MPGRIRNVVHIKHRTAGTSNELSFDVLDAKKHEASSSGRIELPGSGALSRLRGRRKRVDSRMSVAKADAPTTMPKLYTNDASLAAKNIGRAKLPYSNPAAEVKRRKQHRVRVRLVTAAVAVAAVAATGVFVASEVNRFLSDQNELEAMLGKSLNTLEQTDTAIIAMDDLVLKPVAEQDEQQLEQVKAQIDGAAPQLKEALGQAQTASEGLVNSRQREAANQTISAIVARQEMIGVGNKLVEEGIVARQAADNMSQAWKLILEADTLSTEAGKLVTNTTEANVRASMEKTNAATEKFKEAQELVSWVQENYPSADVSAYATYLEKRLTGQQAALDSDAAMLLMDRGTAEEKNQVLFDNDSQAADLAKGFPENPAQGVIDAYQANSEELREKYLQARSQAASADTYLRDYLGDADK